MYGKKRVDGPVGLPVSHVLIGAKTTAPLKACALTHHRYTSEAER